MFFHRKMFLSNIIVHILFTLQNNSDDVPPQNAPRNLTIYRNMSFEQLEQYCKYSPTNFVRKMEPEFLKKTMKRCEDLKNMLFYRLVKFNFEFYQLKPKYVLKQKFGSNITPKANEIIRQFLKISNSFTEQNDEKTFYDKIDDLIYHLSSQSFDQKLPEKNPSEGKGNHNFTSFKILLEVIEKLEPIYTLIDDFHQVKNKNTKLNIQDFDNWKSSFRNSPTMSSLLYNVNPVMRIVSEILILLGHYIRSIERLIEYIQSQSSTLDAETQKHLSQTEEKRDKAQENASLSPFPIPEEFRKRRTSSHPAVPQNTPQSFNYTTAIPLPSPPPYKNPQSSDQDVPVQQSPFPRPPPRSDQDSGPKRTPHAPSLADPSQQIPHPAYYNTPPDKGTDPQPRPDPFYTTDPLSQSPNQDATTQTNFTPGQPDKSSVQPPNTSDSSTAPGAKGSDESFLSKYGPICIFILVAAAICLLGGLLWSFYKPE